MTTGQNNFLDVDWSKLPVPQDDGACRHLPGLELPGHLLAATDGSLVNLSALPGRTVLFVYPLTGRPNTALPKGWDDIPGARGCTPQSCSFRDHFSELTAAGADHVFGLSTQDAAYQREAAERLHLPFALLSDADTMFSKDLGLPVFEVEGRILLKRLALVVDEGSITKVFYPVFPPDQNATAVLDWLKGSSVKGRS
jgi:peroxiredoxin